MAPSLFATWSYASDYETVFDAVCWAALEAGMSVNHADRVSGVISLSAPASWSSWGENLGIRVGQAAPGCIQVAARSTQKLTLVDWGKNAKNIDTLFRQIDAALAGRAQFVERGEMAGDVKQGFGLTAGVIVALVASVTAGASSGSFWRFLVVLTFSMACLGATYWLLVAGRRRRVDH
jgi:hypothetical protein